MNQAIWQIGGLNVSLRGDLSPFKGILSRPPTAPPDGGDAIEVSIAIQNERTWPLAIEERGTKNRKGLDTHQTAIDFQARCIDFLVRAPVSKVASYLLHRNFFCALGGFAGDPLMHASAVVREGRVHVFLAESGGGKSTIANLLHPHAAWLNDEIIWCTTRNGLPLVINQAYWRGEDSCGTEPFLQLAS